MPLGLISNLLSNRSNRRSQKRAEKFNVKFWQMQNEYNHPSAQMARLKEAGLNPNLIYGDSVKGATGAAESIAPSKAVEHNFDNAMSDIHKFADVGVKQAQTNNLKTQNDVLIQESALKAAQTAGHITRNSRDKFDLGIAKELRQTSIDAAREGLRKLEADTIGAQLDNDFKDQSLKNRVKDIFYRVQNAKESLKGQRLLNTLRQLEVDLKKVGIERNDPWYFRIFARNADAINDHVRTLKKQ